MQLLILMPCVYTCTCLFNFMLELCLTCIIILYIIFVVWYGRPLAVVSKFVGQLDISYECPTKNIGVPDQMSDRNYKKISLVDEKKRNISDHIGRQLDFMSSQCIVGTRSTLNLFSGPTKFCSVWQNLEFCRTDVWQNSKVFRQHCSW